MIFCGTRVDVKADQAQIRVRTYPGNSFDDPHKEARIKFVETKLIDPANTPIPLVDEPNWELCTRIHSLPVIALLKDLTDFSVTRGEINQTIFREYITENDKMSRLVKGVEIGRYFFRTRLSQGHKEWFDEKSFLKKNGFKAIVKLRRIATQRITGVDERLRLVATIVDPPAYFADSTNSIACSSKATHKLEYLLGLLNSRLMQWRFKLTSTNNNVGTNELDSLPIRRIDFERSIDRSRHDRMFVLVTAIIKGPKAARSSKE
jgi:hypothetical protein